MVGLFLGLTFISKFVLQYNYKQKTQTKEHNMANTQCTSNNGTYQCALENGHHEKLHMVSVHVVGTPTNTTKGFTLHTWN